MATSNTLYRRTNSLELHKFLYQVPYPATKREVLDVAFDNGANDDELNLLNLLPDQEYIDVSHLLFAIEDL